MKPYYTIEEAAIGATYRKPDGTFTVYEIGEYGSGSVLEGQQKRTFKGTYGSLEAAKDAFPQAELIQGTTYQEPDLGHLPYDPDYDSDY